MVIKTANVNDLPPPEAGFRVLVMRKWPRGVPKEAVDHWIKELGCSPELLREFKKGKVNGAGFQARYIGEVSDPQRRELIDQLQRRSMNGADLVIMCDMEDETYSVRGTLKMILETT